MTVWRCSWQIPTVVGMTVQRCSWQIPTVVGMTVLRLIVRTRAARQLRKLQIPIAGCSRAARVSFFSRGRTSFPRKRESVSQSRNPASLSGNLSAKAGIQPLHTAVGICKKNNRKS
jgi:hypothetical protein